ncbi:iron chaperone [Listeria seeligeri]|uniref:iron chaperone n=1 Tax=Listeria seeligeri TaxID=1640 RepID=UPI0022EBD07B|nr:iron chaperone [Listeria seeligeri]
MEVFAEYLAGIDNPDHRERTKKVLTWVAETFPNLKPEIKWNTPMFSNNGTFIIGISVAKQHMSISPEVAGIERFEEDLKQAGYSHTKGLFKITWAKPVDFSLLEKIIQFNIQDKANYTSFWRV